MKIICKDTMPNGVKIQLEDWSEHNTYDRNNPIYHLSKENKRIPHCSPKSSNRKGINHFFKPSDRPRKAVGENKLQNAV